MQLFAQRFGNANALYALAALTTIGALTGEQAIDTLKNGKFNDPIFEKHEVAYGIAAGNALNAAVVKIANDRGIDVENPDNYDRILGLVARTRFDFNEIDKKVKIDDVLRQALEQRGDRGGYITEGDMLTLEEQETVVQYLGIAWTSIMVMPGVEQDVLTKAFTAESLNGNMAAIGQIALKYIAISAEG